MAEKEHVLSTPNSPWSPFHALRLPGRVPGTPVRQSDLPTLNPPNLLSNSSDPPLIIEEFRDQFITLDLLIEYKLLYSNCPRGVYVLPSAKSLYEWHGVIFVRSGPFESGIFRFTMYVPDGFPRLRPMIRFHSNVYHPYIHASNRVLNLHRGFPPWEPNVHHLWNVVQFIADCFYKEETWSDCESERFADEAKKCVEESLRNIYDHSDDDGNLIKFKNMDEKSFQDSLITLIKGDLPHPPETKPTMLSNVTEHMKQLWDYMVIR